VTEELIFHRWLCVMWLGKLLRNLKSRACKPWYSPSEEASVSGIGFISDLQLTDLCSQPSPYFSQLYLIVSKSALIFGASGGIRLGIRQ
jgi:hypothetical protein